MDDPLISVVVPAWNAAETLAETLASVAAQTCRNIEILIVDDGSTDATAGVAAEFCEREPRARLLSQENSGVAAARNAAISIARGAFIAPIDADDLWHPEKLQRQLACFRSGPPAVGLVYNWSRIIDRNGRLAQPSSSAKFEGSVLREHLRWNFIGNGSTPLIRTEVLREFGYSPELRDAQVEGCEDFLLQLQIASRYDFACVPAFLTGYRISADIMSGDLSRMIRSHVLMYRMLRESLPPEYRRDIDRQLGRQLAALSLIELRRGRISRGSAFYLEAVRSSSIGAAEETASRLARNWRIAPRSHPLLGVPFANIAPEDGRAA